VGKSGVFITCLLFFGIFRICLPIVADSSEPEKNSSRDGIFSGATQRDTKKLNFLHHFFIFGGLEKSDHLWIMV